MTVGLHGRVGLEEAATAARKLFLFTRNELAAELGLKPIAVSKFLSELIDRGLVLVGDVGESGVKYRATLAPLTDEVFEPRPPMPSPRAREPEPPPAPEPVLEHEPPEPDPPGAGRVTPEEVRDWAVMLGKFTTNQLATEMEVGWATANKYLMRLVDQGIVVRVEGEKGPRDATLFELRGAVEERAPKREKRLPPEVEVIEKWSGGAPERAAPIPGTGAATRYSTDKDVNLLVGAAQAFGWEVEHRAKHRVIIIPGAERPIPIPSTPKGSGMVRAFRDQLRAAGMPDIGFANDQPERRSQVTGPVGERSAKHGKNKEKLGSVAGYRRPGRRGKKSPRAA
jgi:DNA-binding transcriptional regulator YhcF (GntR family)